MNIATRSWIFVRVELFYACFCTFLFPEYNKSSANTMATECGKVVWFTASVRLRAFKNIQKPIAFAKTLQGYNILQNNICKGWMNSDVSDAHFRGLVNITGLSRLIDIIITAAQRGPFYTLSLSHEAMPIARSNFPPDTELYRQIIYPEYIPYDKVNAKK